ncbi:MAG: MBL fold metallo-hydrolase [Methanomassiliicoccales archaeon]|jgi:putative mRNA 3-end processing factor|nr:MBL fold metallo-hydrolase [Methanomassiliicoccales archaeon]MDD1756190.1 MBL fold metallo-hydrolase [Methanomassiliicoccales archaeon]
MEGDALSIRPGNGVEVLGREVTCRFDPHRISSTGLNCISHAHSDHLPRGFEGEKAIASRVTLRCASERLGRKLHEETSPHVQMLEAGHIRGSRMFLLDGGSKVLYTGDMCPEDRFGMRGAKPVKADALIIESTYGSRGWDFPPREEIGAVIKDWVEDNLAQDFSVALMTYPLGKSQLLLDFLGELEPYLVDNVLCSTQWVEEEGEERFRYRAVPEGAVNAPSLYICSTAARKGAVLQRLQKGKLRTAYISGWALRRGFFNHMRVDEGFPLSDHAGHDELLSFVKGCDPNIVYTNHGFDEDLASDITRELGIEAKALKSLKKKEGAKGSQKKLAEF